MSDLLKDLTVVIEHFEGPATQDPVKDLAERGVDRAAIEEFMEECIITGLNSGLPIHEGWHMVALSCFHMGMLTQQYVTTLGARDDVQAPPPPAAAASSRAPSAEVKPDLKGAT